MKDQEIINALVQFQRDHNYSQNELAALLDVSRVTLHRWIEGQVQLRAANRRAILKLTGLEVKSCSVENCPFRNADDNMIFKNLLNEWQHLSDSEKYQALSFIAGLNEQKKRKSSSRHQDHRSE